MSFLVTVQLRSEDMVSRESVKLSLSILVIILIVALGIYLQQTDAPIYGIPGILETLFTK